MIEVGVTKNNRKIGQLKYDSMYVLRLVLAQDVHFFYTHFHLSALQNCELIFSTNFQFIFTFKYCTAQFSH